MNDYTDTATANQSQNMDESNIDLGGSYVPEVPQAEPWPDPLPIQSDLPPVERFNDELLPVTLRPWVIDIAERMQCPLDFPAVTAMVALGSLLGRKIAIRPKQFDDWTVYPNLWGMLIGRPSMMKSPPVAQVMRPIRKLADEATATYQDEVIAYQKAVEFHKMQQKVSKEILLKSMRDGQLVELDDCDLCVEPEEPTRKRYVVSDSTMEALSEILADNPSGVLVNRDELIGLLKSLDKVGQESSRTFYVESWTGDGYYETDRIGRGNLQLRTCLSIFGTIQPGPLGAYLGEAMRCGTGDDGLMQRFQLSVWPDDPGPWQVVDRWPDSDAYHEASRVFYEFDRLEASAIGQAPHVDDTDAVPFLRFDDDAQKLFFDWMTQRENAFRCGHESPAMESHLVKYRKLIPVLSLIIQLAEHPHNGSVGIDALDRAIAWSNYLKSHAKRIYSQGAGFAVKHAQALAKRIERGDLVDGFTSRDVYMNHWSLLANKDQVGLATGELIELNWLRKVTIQTGGRPTETFSVNPKVKYQKYQKG